MIKRRGKSYLLRAESDEDCQSWIEQIQQCLVEVNELECEFSDDDEDAAAVSPAPPDTVSDKICKWMQYILACFF